MFLNVKGKLLSLDVPRIMGILNVTEDSFFDGGLYLNDKDLLLKVEKMLSEGADFIDVGAMSTRPGAKTLDEKIECERIQHSVALIMHHFPDTLISVDTWRAEVARMSLAEGACLINDISGGTFDEKMLELVAEERVPYCLMHTPAKPDVMQQCADYEDVISELLRFFGKKIAKLKELGINDIIIDPGFGFGKTLEQNYFLLNNLQAFATLNLPVLVGISRKSMIYKVLETTPQEALNGTSVLHTVALLKGAKILRVHDVKEAKETMKLVQKLSI